MLARMASEQRVLGTAEATEILGISKDTLIRMIARGEVPAKKLPGINGAYIFDAGDIERIAGERDKEPAA